ncbi:MAG: hypothetical protein NT140_12000 [Deltaproteobacteria bacterium]|nr:hypothetical protein [Deltaproteobacteria bacterium]
MKRFYETFLLKKVRGFYSIFGVTMIKRNPLRAAFLLGLILPLMSGCATKMSLEEAKKVTISMAESPAFIPPPPQN